MIFPYRRYQIDPTPTIPSGEAYRPLVPIRVFGPSRSVQLFGLLDTGADNVFLSASLAEILGIDLSPDADLAHAAGGHELDVRSGSIEIAQNGESYRWSLFAGFLNSDDEPAVAFLGHAGFLENLNADFNGAARTIELTADGRVPRVL
jgi:Aspartyl protease